MIKIPLSSVVEEKVLLFVPGSAFFWSQEVFFSLATTLKSLTTNKESVVL